MKGGDGGGITDLFRNRLDILLCHLFKLIQVVQKPLSAFFKNLRIFRIHHAVDKVIDLGLLDPRKVVAHRNIKLKTVPIPQSEFLCDHMKDKPGFYVLAHCLGNIKLCGPLTVVAFILRQDTGTADACRQLLSVHLLYRLQFKKTRACKIGSHDILGKLGMRACRRPDGGF